MLKTLYLVMTIAIATDGSNILDSDAQISSTPITTPEQCQDAGKKIDEQWWAPRNGHMLMTGCSKIEVEVPDSSEPSANSLSDPHAGIPPEVLEQMRKGIEQPRPKSRDEI